MSSGIIRVFQEVNLVRSHQGLTEIAAKHQINLSKLSVGEYVIFLNRAKTAFKLFAAENVIAYYRHPKNHRIDLRAIQFIPQVFQSKKKISYDDALKTALFQKKARDVE